MNDPLFLFSRGIDEALTEEEQQRLDAAGAAREGFVREAGSLQKVDALVRRWAIDPGISTPDEFEAGVMANLVENGRDADLAGVDRSIAEWGKAHPRFHGLDLVHTVVQGVAQHERARSLRWTFRIGLPLAAAACVALAFIGLTGLERAAPVNTVLVGPIAAVADAESFEASRSRVVLFERNAVAMKSAGREELAIAIISVGSVAIEETVEEAPPL